MVDNQNSTLDLDVIKFRAEIPGFKINAGIHGHLLSLLYFSFLDSSTS
jgi:hypothetical protein